MAGLPTALGCSILFGSIKNNSGDEILRILCAILGLCSLFFSSFSMAAEPLNLMPQPAEVQPGSGQFVIDSSFSIAVDRDSGVQLQHAVATFLDQLRKQTGMPALTLKIARFLGREVSDRTSTSRQGDPGTWRGRIVFSFDHAGGREAGVRDAIRRNAWAADFSSTGENIVERICGALDDDSRSASIPVARFDD